MHKLLNLGKIGDAGIAAYILNQFNIDAKAYTQVRT